MSLEEQFNQAAADSKTLSHKPDNDVLLQLYALYKQATDGDAPSEGPDNMFDFVGKAKYDAWNALRGKDRDAARSEYIALVEKLKQSH